MPSDATSHVSSLPLHAQECNPFTGGGPEVHETLPLSSMMNVGESSFVCTGPPAAARHLHHGILFSLRKDRALPYGTTLVNLEHLMFREISPLQKDEPSVILPLPGT